MDIRRGIIRKFDSGTYLADVQIVGSMATMLTGVPVAKQIGADLLTAGTKCGVLFFDETNPADACVVFIYDGVPVPWVTSALIKDGEIVEADLAFGLPVSDSYYWWINQQSNNTTSWAQIDSTVEIDIVIPSGKKMVGIAFVNAYMRVSGGRGVVSVGYSTTGGAPWIVIEAYGFGEFTQTSYNHVGCAHRLEVTGDGSTYTFTPVFRQLDGGRTVYAQQLLQLIIFYALVPV